MVAEETRYTVEIPKLGALILTHDWHGEVRGLKSFPAEDRPYAPVVFWSFRIMVAIGFAMLGLGVWTLWLRWRRRLFLSRPAHWAALLMGPSGFVAVLAGWITTEVGRQPYTVYGLLRTADSASPLDAPAVAVSLAMFALVYFLVFGVGVFYLLRLMGKAPQIGEHGPDSGVPTRAGGVAAYTVASIGSVEAQEPKSWS